MTRNDYKAILTGAAFSLAAVVVACGGGGGGGGTGGGGGGILPTIAPTATPTPPPSYTVSGTVNALPSACDGVTANCTPTGQVSGAVVTIGSIPASGQGGAPVAPLYTATTAANGSFSILTVPAGSYEIEVKPTSQATTATLHAKLTVNGSTGAQTYGLSTLGAGEQTWFNSLNTYRTGKSVSAIFADEYAMEAGRAYAEFLESNTICSPTCVNYPQFAAQYAADGGIFNYGDSYRAALSEANCPAFTQSDPNQGPMLAQATAVFGGYGYRNTSGGSCAFSIVRD